MTLSTGARLEHYEIVAAIGAGGMGEVYRARDTKLGRDVAFKVLPAVFANDADRLSRFQREAHLQTRKHFIEHATKSPDIRSLICSTSPHLFRRHVSSRAHQDVRLGGIRSQQRR